MSVVSMENKSLREREQHLFRLTSKAVLGVYASGEASIL